MPNDEEALLLLELEGVFKESTEKATRHLTEDMHALASRVNDMRLMTQTITPACPEGRYVFISYGRLQIELARLHAEFMHLHNMQLDSQAVYIRPKNTQSE